MSYIGLCSTRDMSRFEYLEQSKQKEIILLLWVFKCCSNTICVPPKFIRQEIFKFIILDYDNLLQMFRHYATSINKAPTHITRHKLLCKLMNYTIKHKHVIYQNSGLQNVIKNMCVTFARDRNVWLTTQFHELFGENLKSEVDASIKNKKCIS